MEKLKDCRIAIEKILDETVTPDNANTHYKLMMLECDRIEVILVDMLTKNWNISCDEIKEQYFGEKPINNPLYFDNCYIQAMIKVKMNEKQKEIST